MLCVCEVDGLRTGDKVGCEIGLEMAIPEEPDGGSGGRV
jgi:hypothetical protein